MTSLVQGVHHITLCPGGAQQDIDFFTQILGQRLVKQTVLMDGNIPIYHFYYGNADADVGSIATCFPYSRKPGRAGSGQLSCTSYTVPNGAIAFWKEHCDRHRAEHSGVQERFGTKYLWTTTQIPRDAGTRGFFGAVLSVRDVRDQESFFVDALGFRKVGVDGPYHRFEVPGTGPGRIVDLHVEPERAPGSWGFGSGTAHHIAFNVETDDALVKQKAVYEELGFTDASEIKDRFYFHSMYVRSRVASSSSARRMSRVVFSRTRRRTNSGRSCSCRHGSRTSAMRSSRSWSPSRSRKKTGRGRKRRRHRGRSSPHTPLRETSPPFLCLVTRPRSTRISRQRSIRKLDITRREFVYFTDTRDAGAVSLDARERLFAVQRACTDPAARRRRSGRRTVEKHRRACGIRR
ncbi:MAG: hypothetical protein DMG03_12380 [Acidobacteria bacterium]|nr:MAG: hypothetical protein DMG03_12380 [Acidobacteriota bacterium]